MQSGEEGERAGEKGEHRTLLSSCVQLLTERTSRRSNHSVTVGLR